jgi:hypothetical protein
MAWISDKFRVRWVYVKPPTRQHYNYTTTILTKRHLVFYALSRLPRMYHLPLLEEPFTNEQTLASPVS